MGQNNCKPQPGDLIEIDRPRHQHWALYVGDGYVINLTPVDKQDLKVGVHTVPLFIRKVKKQLLTEVVKNHRWRVNNKYDHSYTPLAVKEIIQRAGNCNGRELKYRGFGSNCEHFVTELRYGEGVSCQLRASVGSELQILDMTEEKDSPNPGDLIEINWGPYEHWALYVGDGYVINFTPLDEGAPYLSSSREPILTRKARVTKKLLKEVVGKDDWAVNNKCDGYRTPLPVEEIIWRAQSCIGTELTYDVLGTCSEEFLIMFRYGGQPRALLCGEMHIPDRAEDKDYPNPGDLIEIKRGRYAHWALYLGKGQVIHVTTDGVTSLSASSDSASSGSASSGSVALGKATVNKADLKGVAGNDTWSVNNKYDCYRTPFPMEEIIRRAEPWIGKELPYRLFFKNCEHFVTELRYGDGVSEQANVALQDINSTFATVAASIVVTSLISPDVSVVVLPLVAASPLAAAGGGLLACVAFKANSIANSFSFSQFKKAGRDILEQSCC